MPIWKIRKFKNSRKIQAKTTRVRFSFWEESSKPYPHEHGAGDPFCIPWRARRVGGCHDGRHMPKSCQIHVGIRQGNLGRPWRAPLDSESYIGTRCGDTRTGSGHTHGDTAVLLWLPSPCTHSSHHSSSKPLSLRALPDVKICLNFTYSQNFHEIQPW